MRGNAPKIYFLILSIISLSWSGRGNSSDFIVSQNLLPLGSLVLCLFAFAKQGWGKARFVTELEAGQKWSFPGIILFYWQYLLPLIILVIFATGYWQKFF